LCSSRIGILGGSFSPPHNAHLALGIFAKDQFDLDVVFVIPGSTISLGKTEKPIANHHRYNMAVLACKNVDFFHVLDCELQNNPVYTVQTLKSLRKKYTRAELFFIAGADNFKNIDSWHEPQEIAKLTSFIIAPRNDFLFEAFDSLKKVGTDTKNIFTLDFPRIDVSSTMIRERLRKDLGCSYLVSDAVLRYIKINRLFKED